MTHNACVKKNIYIYMHLTHLIQIYIYIYIDIVITSYTNIYIYIELYRHIILIVSKENIDVRDTQAKVPMSSAL